MTTLLVASSGGHLAQLHQLRPRLEGIDDHVRWVTFETPQSSSLLVGEDVRFIGQTTSRDYRALIANLPAAMSLMGDRDVTGVVSTGAGIALAFLPQARLRRRRASYIESATRVDGPSTTGRLLQLVPGIELYAQHRGWAGGRWRFGGSVFDGYESQPAGNDALRRVVVTLGAHPLFGFRRLVDRLLALLPNDVEVFWQTGATNLDGLGIEAHASVPAAELEAAMRDADLVVAHAGIGATLAALEAGRCPVVVPRSASHGEHVDDHQHEVARELETTGLVVARTVDELSAQDLLNAAARRTVRDSAPPPFRLGA